MTEQEVSFKNLFKNQKRDQIKARRRLQMTAKRIRHMVLFCLKHDQNSPETEKFLLDGKKILSSISTVENFEVLNQTSPKNQYHFSFSMEFSGREAYDAYTAHPDHRAFVKLRWEKEVASFLEIDLTGLF
jgi:hypothetical protein